MENEIPYVLIVGAKPSDSENYAFQVSYDYIKRVTDKLSAICVYSPEDPGNPSGPGYLDIIFNQEPTFKPGGSEYYKIDSCLRKENGHNDTKPVNNFVNLGSFGTFLMATLEVPTPNEHAVSIGNNLRFRVDRPTSAVSLSFLGGLANAGGVTVGGQGGATSATLRVTLQNEGTTDQPNWVAHWSKEYGGDL